VDARLVAGIVFGLGAALAQSLSYIASRHFLARSGAGARALWVTSHLLMGVWSLAALPFLWGPGVPPPRAWIGPLAGVSVFYLVGQAAIFRVLKTVPSSRVAPMLGSKIVILALITAFALDRPLSGLQWAGVVMSAAAAWLLNETGGRLPWRTSAAVAVAVLGYCLSDLSITALVRALQPAGPRAPLLGVALSYVLCGLVALPFLAWRADCRAPAVWRLSAPYALAWFVAMGFLFACFGAVGVVFGNILQASRGLLSIALGVALASRGLTHLEERVSPSVVWRRTAAAVLMMAAVAAYVLPPPAH
jgi:hypothetical protein